MHPCTHACAYVHCTQARDLVEGSVKPGSSSLQLLSAVAPLIRTLGPKADPSNLKRLPIAAAAVWALYAGSVGGCKRCRRTQIFNNAGPAADHDRVCTREACNGTCKRERCCSHAQCTLRGRHAQCTRCCRHAWLPCAVYRAPELSSQRLGRDLGKDQCVSPPSPSVFS